MPRQGRRVSEDPTVVPLRRGLSEARRYTPRGRTVRERTVDPFRPALEVAAEPTDKRAGRGRPSRAATPPPVRSRATKQKATPNGSSKTRVDRPTSKNGRKVKPARVPQQRRIPTRKPPRPPARPPKLGEPRRRLRMATLIVFALFLMIGGRLVQLQLTDAQAYANAGLADRLHQVVLGAPRGAIYDRTGAVLAHSAEARYVYADPAMIDNPVEAAAKLSPVLGVAVSELMPNLVEHDRPGGGPSRFEWLARGVDIGTAKSVMALQIKGVGVERDERREVPGHDLAANLLGFVGDDLHGLEGLEARFDELLFGVNGERETETGLGDLAAPIPGGYLREIPAQPGSSLTLTIDRDLQFMVQKILAKRMQQVSASLGCAVVLDIATGEVLAQASYPGYDAVAPLKAQPAQRTDACTGTVVDPGSVHKAITLGAALQEGVITPDSAIPVEPKIRKADKEFTDTHWLPPGTRLSLPGILAYSSNVGTIKIADQLGAQRLYEYQRRFGLGESTEVGVPGEADGIVQPPENWSGSSYGSIPVGHSVSVTPIQMAAAYAAIANNGVWVRPHLVRETIRPDGTRVPAPTADTRTVLSAQNAAALRRALEAVVTVPGGTGRSAAIANYRVAGKTGTGSRVDNGRYLPGEVASFIGMAPADAPRYVIAVFAHTPGGAGGVIAGPAFKEMMEFTLRHYKVPPTGTEPPKFVITP